jgi:hypothetical protein
MDFIERLFGIAPDGGNGTLEASLLALGAAVLALACVPRLFRAVEGRRRLTPVSGPTHTDRLARGADAGGGD